MSKIKVVDLNRTIQIDLQEMNAIKSAMACFDNIPMSNNATYRATRTINRISSAMKSLQAKNTVLLQKHGIKGPAGNFFIPKEGTPDWVANPDKHASFNEFFEKQGDLMEEKVDIDIFPLSWESVFGNSETINVNKTQLSILTEYEIVVSEEDQA